MHTDSEMRSTLSYDFMRYMNAGSREMSDEPLLLCRALFHLNFNYNTKLSEIIGMTKSWATYCCPRTYKNIKITVLRN